MSYFKEIDAKGKSNGSWYPVLLDELIADQKAQIRLDAAGNLICRSAILTDEGSFYEPFAGITLSDEWNDTIGTGGSLAVADSKLTISSGTTNDASTYVDRGIDFSPISLIVAASISQRIANQDIYIGLSKDSTPNASQRVRFHFSGTDNTKVICESRSSDDIGGEETLTVTIPHGLTTASTFFYKIIWDGKIVKFYIGNEPEDLILLATFFTQTPDPYEYMYLRCRVTNGTSAASNTNLIIDAVQVNNFNNIDTNENNVYRTVDQHVRVSSSNNSTTNLAVGNSYTFTGAAETTLGIAGIQVSLMTDKNCIVKIQQSSDGVNWDLSDQFTYTALSNFGNTIQSISSFYRILVTSNAETTSYFRLQTVLCPTIEALPRSLDINGNLKIAAPVDNIGFNQENTPMGEVKVSEPTRLVGTSFEGTTIDSNFWTTAAAGVGASIAQANAKIVINSGTANAATVTSFSSRRARYLGGSGMRYRAVINVSAGVANNVRRWGIGWGSTAMPTVTDGAYFKLSGTTFSINVMKGGVETSVVSFNGSLGYNYSPGITVNTYEIYWTNSKVWFVVGGDLLHIFSASLDTWSNTMSFHVFSDSVNSAAVTSVLLETRTSTIYRLGKIETEANFIFLGANATTVLKYSGGKIHNVINCDNAGAVILYDNTAGSGTIIANLDLTQAIGTLSFDCPFFNGLTAVVSGGGKATIVYE